jgi:hypothetical protein
MSFSEHHSTAWWEIAIGIAPVMQIGIAFLETRTRALDANQCRFTAMRDLRASLR